MGKMHKCEKACWGILICIFAIVICLEIIYFVLAYGFSFFISQKEFSNNSLAFPQLTFCPRNDSLFANSNAGDMQQYALNLFVPSAVNVSLTGAPNFWDQNRINTAAQLWTSLVQNNQGLVQNNNLPSGLNVLSTWSYNCLDVFKSCAVGNNRFPCCQNAIFNVTSRGPCVVLPLRQLSDTIYQNRPGIDGGLHIEINVVNPSYRGGYLFLNDRYEYYIASEPIPLQYTQNSEIFISLKALTRRSYCPYRGNFFWSQYNQLQRPAFYYNFGDYWYDSSWQWDWHNDQYWWFNSQMTQQQDWPGPDCYMGCLKQSIDMTCGCTPYNLDSFGRPGSAMCNSTRNDQCVQPFLIANDPLSNCTRACGPMRRCHEKWEYNPDVMIVPWETAAQYPPPGGNGPGRQMIHIYHKRLAYQVNQEEAMFGIGGTLHEIGALIILWVCIYLVIFGFIWLCKCCCCPNRVRSCDDKSNNNPPPLQPPVFDSHKTVGDNDREIGTQNTQNNV